MRRSPSTSLHAGTGQLRQRRLTEAARPLGRVDQVTTVAGIAIDERRREARHRRPSPSPSASSVPRRRVDWRRAWYGAGPCAAASRLGPGRLLTETPGASVAVGLGGCGVCLVGASGEYGTDREAQRATVRYRSGDLIARLEFAAGAGRPAAAGHLHAAGQRVADHGSARSCGRSTSTRPARGRHVRQELTHLQRRRRSPRRLAPPGPPVLDAHGRRRPPMLPNLAAALGDRRIAGDVVQRQPIRDTGVDRLPHRGVHRGGGVGDPPSLAPHRGSTHRRRLDEQTLGAESDPGAAPVGGRRGRRGVVRHGDDGADRTPQLAASMATSATVRMLGASSLPGTRSGRISARMDEVAPNGLVGVGEIAHPRRQDHLEQCQAASEMDQAAVRRAAARARHEWTSAAAAAPRCRRRRRCRLGGT